MNHRIILQSFLRPLLNLDRASVIRVGLGLLMTRFALSLLPWCFGLAVDKILIAKSDFELILGVMFSILALLFVTTPVVAFWQAQLVQKVIKSLTLSWYDQLFKKELNFFKSESPARILSVLNRSILTHERMLAQIIEVLLPILVEWIIAGALILSLAGSSALAFVFSIVIAQMSITLFIIRRRRPLLNSVNDIEDQSAEDAQTLIQNGFVFQVNGNIRMAVQRLECIFSKYEKAAVSLSPSASILSLLPFGFQSFTQIVGLFGVGLLIRAGSLSIGQGLAIIALMVRFSTSTAELVGILRFMDQFGVDVSELKKLLGRPRFERAGRPKAKVNSITVQPSLISRGDCRLQIQSGLSFNQGDRVAIIGPSGGGKSTFLEALALCNPEYRSLVSLGNVGACDYSSHAQTSMVSYGPQDPMIFSGTCLQNLMQEMGSERIDFVLKALSLEHLLGRRAEKIDLSRLSGGESKRMAVARTLLRPAEIFMFDEPTAGLNEELRKKTWDFILQETINKILIVVTHDESELGRFNRVLRVADGQVG